MAAFRAEIRRIQLIEGNGLGEVKNINELGEVAFRFWNELKEFAKITDKKEILKIGDVINKETWITHTGTLDEGHEHLNNDEQRFIEWIRTKVASVEALAEFLSEDNLSKEDEERYLKELEGIIKRLGL